MKNGLTKNEGKVFLALKDGLERSVKKSFSIGLLKISAYELIDDTNKSRAFKRGLNGLLKKGFVVVEDGRYKIF